ncbi:DUF1905 domain-containing protein [Georgenia deserti]|uniref:DUF1905 domain-containing protein n=1 Tax=Georgenia deserti TaxID=2093781 RepID=A0ABW4L865_9MICO
MTAMELDFTGELFEWRGPPPYVFVAVPDDPSDAIREIANAVTYGWGVIPVTARIGRAEFTTSLFPKDGQYLLPVKLAVRRAERIDVGDGVAVSIDIAPP